MRRKRKPAGWKASVVFLLLFACGTVVVHRHTQMQLGRRELLKTLLIPEEALIAEESIIGGVYVARYRTMMVSGAYSSEFVFRGCKE